MAYQTTVITARFTWVGLSAGLLSTAMACLSASTASAATFSFSGSQVSLRNFSLLPQSQESTQITDAIAKTDEGTVDNFFNGFLQFEGTVNQLQLNGLGEVRSQGTGTLYRGKSRREATVLAQFLVQPLQPFSFDFQTTALIRNTVDQPTSESALSLANISLQLLASDQTVLQFFKVKGALGDNGIGLDPNGSVEVEANTPFLQLDRQTVADNLGNFGLLLLSRGRFEQTVTQPTQLTLVVQTLNQTCIQAPNSEHACASIPEPSNLWALSWILGLGLLRSTKRGRKVRFPTTF